MSHIGHDLSDFFVDKNEVHYMLGCAGELPTEFFLVRSHSDMARVRMANASHDADDVDAELIAARHRKI